MSEREDVRRSYEAVADDYASRIFGELASKPLDRMLLETFADDVRGAGPVCDLGCGPGHVGRYLHERGVDAFGLDLSPRMVEIARVLNPGMRFEIGDVLALDAQPNSWAGAVAFYSLIHFSAPQLARALSELHRVLRFGAPLLIGVHKGNETRHIDEWWGHSVCLDAVFFEAKSLSADLEATAFRIEEVTERPPYAGAELETERLYIYARACEEQSGRALA